MRQDTQDSTSPDWPVRVVPVGMVPPGLPETLMQGAEGTVQEGGAIELDDVDGTYLKLEDPSTIEPGTRVYVSRGRGVEVCRPVEARERQLKEKKAQNFLDARERRQRRKEARQEAESFWEQYDIPFEYDVTIKGRRSGLSKGSWGDGRAKDTVEHLYVQEAFEDGRLSRPKGVYLCNNNAKFRFDEGERRQDENGESFIPPVTCKTCLDRMKRWKTWGRE
ncbi:hypothetical protein HLRTI_000491 [Halorhabdus tiamatea SARL4B]|uniref:Uncharacterized protein n=1 Tax=Halorhabdus tiamatea SARL4B TaxID=1033806 RepID=U2FGV4_9EURY|nr:hypothetical protein [Halorhabdus tiamatea]ERJ07449.1 hypothetical protein HLRTI_000491 [Halorhabdus tiamatea SARL4B]